MGRVRDRIARAIATSNIEKGPNLPAGATTIGTDALMASSGLAMQQTYGNNVALPRAPFSATVPFGPGNPIIPGAINPINPATGRPEPRRNEYQVAQNINIVPTRLVPFTTLRAAADSIDILRRCVEVTKAKMNGLQFDIVLGADASEKIAAESGGDHVRAMAKAREKYTDEINRLREFWENPDKAKDTHGKTGSTLQLRTFL